MSSINLRLFFDNLRLISTSTFSFVGNSQGAKIKAAQKAAERPAFSISAVS